MICDLRSVLFTPFYVYRLEYTHTRMASPSPPCAEELTTEVMQPGDHPHSLLITMAEDFGVDPSSVPDVVDFLRNLDARTIDSYRQEKQEEFSGLVASLSQTPTDVMVAVGVATVRVSVCVCVRVCSF